MNKLDKLREMLREMEDSVFGDVLGGVCLMFTLYAILVFAVVL
jgi:hypothetical protein